MSDDADNATADTVEIEQPPAKRGGMQRVLDGIEKVGNKVPHPAIIFVGLCVLVIVLSAILAAFDVSVTYDVAVQPPLVAEQEYVGGSVVPEPEISPDQYLNDEMEIVQETTEIESLLSADGIRFLFSSFVNNFASFSVVAVVFVAMIGVGVAEEAGMMAALIRKLVKAAPPATLAFIIVFVGGLSSIATDAGYLILVPLGAAAFYSIGRHPLAGLVAAYAGVSAAFAVNILITPLDSLLTEVTNEAIALADPNKSIDLTANLWFNIASTFFCALVITFIVQRITEPALGKYVPDADIDLPEEEVPEGEGRGLRLRHLWPARWAGGHRVVDGAVGCPAAQPGDRLDLQQLAADGEPDLHHHDAVPDHGHLLRDRGEDDLQQHGRDQRHHQDVRRARRPGLHAAADQPVHRLLQLQQHPHRRRREHGRLAGERRHRSAVAAHRVHPRDRDPRPDHARGAARSGRSSPRSSCPCSCASTWHRRPSSPPTASVTGRST